MAIQWVSVTDALPDHADAYAVAIPVGEDGWDWFQAGWVPGQGWQHICQMGRDLTQITHWAKVQKP